jgi:hypothetical protein
MRKIKQGFEVIWMTVIGVWNAKSHFLDVGKMSQSRVLMQPVLNDVLMVVSFHLHVCSISGLL